MSEITRTKLLGCWLAAWTLRPCDLQLASGVWQDESTLEKGVLAFYRLSLCFCYVAYIQWPVLCETLKCPITQDSDQELLVVTCNPYHNCQFLNYSVMVHLKLKYPFQFSFLLYFLHTTGVVVFPSLTKSWALWGQEPCHRIVTSYVRVAGTKLALRWENGVLINVGQSQVLNHDLTKACPRNAT